MIVAAVLARIDLVAWGAVTAVALMAFGVLLAIRWLTAHPEKPRTCGDRIVRQGRHHACRLAPAHDGAHADAAVRWMRRSAQSFHSWVDASG